LRLLGCKIFSVWHFLACATRLATLLKQVRDYPALVHYGGTDAVHRLTAKQLRISSLSSQRSLHSATGFATR